MKTVLEAASGAAEKAAALWDLTDLSLIAERENLTYEARDGAGRRVAFRQHRVGYRTRAQINSELAWMRALTDDGLKVPAPLFSERDRVVEVVDGTMFSALTWAPGVPMGETGVALSLTDRTGVFHRIGVALARLHDTADRWKRPGDFERPDWGVAGLIGDDPLWGRFWEHPALSTTERELLVKARGAAADALANPPADFGLIHADALRENVLLNGDDIWLIDFDDSAFGFRLFDVITTLAKNEGERDYPTLRDALLAGYRTMRPLDTKQWQLMRLLRSFTYLGWIISRMDETGAEARSARFIADAVYQSQTYLAH